MAAKGFPLLIHSSGWWLFSLFYSFPLSVSPYPCCRTFASSFLSSSLSLFLSLPPSLLDVSLRLSPLSSLLSVSSCCLWPYFSLLRQSLCLSLSLFICFSYSVSLSLFSPFFLMHFHFFLPPHLSPSLHSLFPLPQLTLVTLVLYFCSSSATDSWWSFCVVGAGHLLSSSHRPPPQPHA